MSAVIICGRTGAWSDDWSWWGSERQIDDAEPVVKTCSDTCRKGLDAATLSRIAKTLRANPEHVERAA